VCGRITATVEFSDIRVRWNLDRDLPNLRISGTVEATVADNYYLPLGEMKLIIKGDAGQFFHHSSEG
jgi:hypothetical protein